MTQANPGRVPKLTVSRAPGQSNSGGKQAPEKIR